MYLSFVFMLLGMISTAFGTSKFQYQKRVLEVSLIPAQVDAIIREVNQFSQKIERSMCIMDVVGILLTRLHFLRNERFGLEQITEYMLVHGFNITFTDKAEDFKDFLDLMIQYYYFIADLVGVTPQMIEAIPQGEITDTVSESVISISPGDIQKLQFTLIIRNGIKLLHAKKIILSTEGAADPEGRIDIHRIPNDEDIQIMETFEALLWTLK
jgi:hypothetical protein